MPAGTFNAAGSSAEKLVSTGYVQCATPQTYPLRAFGLCYESAPADPTLDTIAFAWVFMGDDTAQIAEVGVDIENPATPGLYTFSTVAATDVWRIAVERGSGGGSNVLTYLKNGVVLYTSLIEPSFPLWARGSFASGSSASEITNASMYSLAEVAPPQVMLRMSDDGGKTWGAEQMRSAGERGEYLTRVRWNRLGAARRRVFEVSGTGAIHWRLTGAFIESQGTEKP